MLPMNQYRLLEDVYIDDRDVLFSEKGAGLILELTPDGIVHIWPKEPIFRYGNLTEDAAEENQDLTDYLIDGDWATQVPWMYFNDLDEVMVLMNRMEIPVSYTALGSHLSIRAARASL